MGHDIRKTFGICAAHKLAMATLASSLLGGCATQNYDAAQIEARTRAPAMQDTYGQPQPAATRNGAYVGPLRNEEAINYPIMAWGFNNYANTGSIEGCYQIQDFRGIDMDGRERIVTRVVGAYPHISAAECKTTGAISQTIRGTGNVLTSPFRQY